VYRRPSLSTYLSQLWDRRHFIRADARGRVISGTRGTALGTAWLVLTPILDGVVYFLIFGMLLKSSRGIENFLGYLIVGVFLFQFTTQCLMGGARSLISGQALIKSFTFPRAALPIAVVMRQILTLVPLLGAMFVLILAIPPRETITWRWLLFPVILGVQSVFNLGLALLAARATAKIPDLTHIIGFLMRFWLYGSAVFFSYERFIEHPTILQAMQLNPMFMVLDMSRDVLLYGVTPNLHSWIVLCSWTATVVVGGIIFIWRGEESYGNL
jgi:teichoic acid transport system permease protein